MEYLKEGKRCDRLVWQLYNKNDKLGGTRLTNGEGDVRDPSLVSSRQNFMAKVKEQKSHEEEEEGKVLLTVAKAWGRSIKRGEGDVYKREGKGKKSQQEIDK